MTARRRESGTLEIVSDAWQNKTIRMVLLALVATGHPIGQRLLGIQTPAAEDIKALTLRVQEAETAQKATASDIKDIKKDLGEIKSESETFHRTFTGFQIDFDKYRKQQPNP